MTPRARLTKCRAWPLKIVNPIIPSPEPVEVPAVAAKTFDSLWLYSLSALMPSPEGGRLSAEFIPVNSETGEMLPGATQTISTDKLPQALAEVPELQAAFAAVVAAVEPVRAWIAQQEGGTDE